MLRPISSSPSITMHRQFIECDESKILALLINLLKTFDVIEKGRKNNYKMMKSTRQMIAKEDFDIWIIPPFYLSLIVGSTIQNLFLPRTNDFSFLLCILYLFKNNISTRKSVEVPVDKSRGSSMGKSSSRLTIAERVFERVHAMEKRGQRTRWGGGWWRKA